ncbi:pyridoxal phosphate-dependent decarboxylase family protein [Bacteroidota bacterium]
MDELIKKAYDPEDFRKKGHKLVDFLADHLKDCQQKNKKTLLSWKDPDSRLKDWQEKFMTGKPEDFNQFLSDLLKDTIHIHHPNYIGHQNTPPLPTSALSEMIHGCLNNGSAIYEMGPASTVMERIVIKWISEKIGMSTNADGFLTSGGTAGNLTGLLAARQAISDFDIWEKGQGNNKYAIMVSSEAHYSIERSVKILGWGEEGIIKVPVDENYCLDPKHLENLYKKALDEGKKVIAIVANACSTSTGNYDPCDLIADFCEKYNLWFHVDGAHGAPAALTDKYNYLTKGIERADSVVIDFHKMLMTSALVTAVIFKNGGRSYETFAQNASYILDPDKDYKWYNSAIRTLECTKNMMGLKVYMQLSMNGAELFTTYITRQYDLTRTFAQKIQQSENFELAVFPQSNILCFRYLPEGSNSEQDLDNLTDEIRKRITEEGEFYIVQTIVSGKKYFRLSIMNPFTGIEECENLLEKIIKTSDGIKKVHR